ncbi:hypothetical protein CQW23_11827 [Capsicum baccatum]|uniref:Ubiquitin-like protease family profile domain-containing protein n=1 Tax=Capsicum baccatum TaxID=33114 RepID=A0A2G2WR06_CAPBA|nr:hypothetical protein CQW23_11827 [Capsicum baccatum]
MIEGFQLKEDESGFPPEIDAYCSDKRSVVDVQSQVDLDIQGFEEFSTVPLAEILKKAGLINDASTSHPTNSDEKWDDIKLFLQSYDVEGCSEDNATTSLDALVESVVNHNSDNTNVETSTTVHVHNDHMDVEGVSADIGPATLECLVVAVENQKPDNDNVGTSNMQPPLDFSDAVVAAHQAAKIPAKIAKRIRMRFKFFKSPYTTEYASGSKAIEDHIEEQKQQFTFDGFLISDTMPSSVIEEFKQWVEEGLLKFHAKKNDQDYRFTTTNYFFKNYIDKTYPRYYEDDTDTVLTTQQDYVESVRVALIEKAITHIIKGYCMSSGLPWHQVDEVRRNTESITEIQKMAKMLPTYLSDNKFYDETSSSNWPNLETYRDKITQTTQILNEHPFDVENCGVFVAGYAKYLSEEMNVSSDGFEAEYHRMRYATLLRKYGIQKAKKDYVSKNDDPP